MRRCCSSRVERGATERSRCSAAMLRAWTLWLVLGACNGSGGDQSFGDGGPAGGPGSPSSGPSLAAIPNASAPADDATLREYYQDFCALYARCGNPLYEDAATCVEDSLCGVQGIVIPSALTRGELLSCSRSLRDVSCDTTTLLVNDACRALVNDLAMSAGVLVDVAGGCGAAVCGADEYCDRTEPSCPSCRQPVALGQPCVGARCEYGAYCEPSSQRCAMLLPEGMPCDSSSQCARSGFAKGDFLRCRQGVCAKAASEHEPCASATDCELRLACIAGVCTARKRQGAPCDSNDACGSFHFCIASTCTQVCGFRQKGDGELCGYDYHCRTGFCDELSASCVPPLQPGEACRGDTQCGDTQFCDSRSGTCAVRAAPGSACTRNEGCASDYCGPQGLCEAAPTCR